LLQSNIAWCHFKLDNCDEARVLVAKQLTIVDCPPRSLFIAFAAALKQDDVDNGKFARVPKQLALSLFGSNQVASKALHSGRQ
jgi:hypothetical protein